MVCRLLYILKHYFIHLILRVIKIDLTVKTDFPYYVKYFVLSDINYKEYTLCSPSKITTKRLIKL